MNKNITSYTEHQFNEIVKIEDQEEESYLQDQLNDLEV